MPALWDGYEFHDDELRFWSQEIFAAALELPERERAAFIGHACEGSGPLSTQVELLLADAWGDRPAPQFHGACRPGDVIRDCLILRPLGFGGMGEVYKAIQRPLRRIVAVKVVTGGHGVSPMFAREAANTARLLHPNIAAVYDADVHAERPCIVMEYVEGISLRTWIERHWRTQTGPPSADLLRSVVRQVALALGEAHRRGLVHRDVKPENILLTRRAKDYTVKVVDFGVARRVDTPGGAVVGTPGYVAPEQLNGVPADRRADLFALGVILYELLTGRHPFAGRTDAETYFNTLGVVPEVPTDGPCAELSAIVQRALEKAPESRYQTAEALLADLDARDTESRDPGLNPLLSELPPVVQRWCARRRSGFGVAFFSLLWGCASLVLSIVSRAACVRVLWAAPGLARGHEMMYGYSIEPNAGLWYLAGASVCFLTGFGFLEAAHRGLARTKTLSVAAAATATGPPSPLERIAARNRRTFRYVTPVIIALAVCFVTVPEIAFRGDHAFGWVQADLAGEQVSKTYDDLRRAGKVGTLPSVAGLCEGCSIRVAGVFNGSNGFQPPSPVWFAIFLAAALTHQIALVSFLWWIFAKILFFFGLLSTALLGGAKHGLRLTPDFQDTDDYRFGLGRLDNVYYTMLVFVAVGSIGLFLQAAANVSKGTYFLAGDPAPALFGQAVLLLGTLGLLALLLLTPVCVFLLLTIKTVDEELARLSVTRKSLEARLSEEDSVDERRRLQLDLDRIRARRETARRQSLLPIRQPAFLALLAASLLMLIVLPLSIQWFSRPAPTTGDGRQTVRDAVCAACGNAPLRLR
jgi:Protein kinase domain